MILGCLENKSDGYYLEVLSFSGGRTKVEGLNLIMARPFLGESTIAFSFDSTWLFLVVGTSHHEPKAEFWIS